MVRELVPTVLHRDGRQADVFIRGMRIGNGLPVVGDMCMGNALHANGTPHDDAATEDGKTIERLTRDKYNKYSGRVGAGVPAAVGGSAGASRRCAPARA